MNNGFFKKTDRKADMIEGLPIHKEWWSRCYEYPWALNYIGNNFTAADMGCGRIYRPFHHALSKRAKKVYAIDIEMIEFFPKPGVLYLTADFTKKVKSIKDNSIDRVFCISVLEDLQDRLDEALKEFKRIKTEDGLVIITIDVPYDASLPTEPYPGIDPRKFYEAVENSELEFLGEVDTSIDNAVFNEEFNLCVFHCVLI